MSNETDSHRRHFIPEWAAAKGVTRAQIIELTGVDKSNVSRWYSTNALPRPRYLNMLAKVFGVDVSDLFRAPVEQSLDTSAMVEKEISESINEMVRGSVDQTDNLPYGGLVEDGAFRPRELMDQSKRRVDFGSVHRFNVARQAAYEIRGDSMELRGLQDGMWAIGINALDYADIYRRTIQDEDIVIVRRSRFQGSEIELSVKEVRLRRDRTELIPKSKNPAHKTLEIPAVTNLKNEESDSNEWDVEIVAIVAWAGWYFL